MGSQAVPGPHRAERQAVIVGSIHDLTDWFGRQARVPFVSFNARAQSMAGSSLVLPGVRTTEVDVHAGWQDAALATSWQEKQGLRVSVNYKTDWFTETDVKDVWDRVNTAGRSEPTSLCVLEKYVGTHDDVCHHGLVDVGWPRRREDVLSALRTLSAEPPVLDGGGRDTRWPDLANAVHWLVDDTPWDLVDPAASIGTILRNSHEADVVREVVAAVVAVSDRQGATTSDAAWFGDSGWCEVRRLAADALTCLTALHTT